MNLDRTLVCDTEVYPNYLLIKFKKVNTYQYLEFESFNGSPLNTVNVLHLLQKYTIVTFNGIKFDSLILEAAIAGYSTEKIHEIANRIIIERWQPWQVRKQYGLARLAFDHVDLIEVLPGEHSLKLYAARRHIKHLMDLPIEPGSIIKESDLPGMRKYCGYDLIGTEELLLTKLEAVELREKMGEEYGVDLRSKSDAQIAEAVFKHELETKYGITPKRPKIETGKRFRYNPPWYLEFESETMREIFTMFKRAIYTVGKSGHIDLPKELKGKTFTLGSSSYKIGIGGLHSREKKTTHITDDFELFDYDVASYYPAIILNNGYYPKHLGKPFLKIFKGIVDTRLKAKRSGDNVTNESLKITINGSFGKFGSKWSFLYSPDLMMHVTITGQLSLLMLIESLELTGINVVSGNTDGIVLKLKPEQKTKAIELIKWWEFVTCYEMEETPYLGLYSRDVNNYIAISENKSKAIGAYADPHNSKNLLKINPANEICADAVIEYLRNGTPIEVTINNCADIKKFITVRTVNGGAVKDGEHIGKVIRWYYGINELGAIHYKTTGNKVPRSDGGIPIMTLPDELPEDLDHGWYVEEARKILKEIGLN